MKTNEYFSQQAVESVLSEFMHRCEDVEETVKKVHSINTSLCESSIFMGILKVYVEKYKKVETDEVLITTVLVQAVQMFILGYDTCKTEKEAFNLEKLVKV